MLLGLSSAAAPGAAPGDLLDACARRGLSALELHAAGTAADHADNIAAASSDAAAHVVGIAGVLCDADPCSAVLALLRDLRLPLVLGQHHTPTRLASDARHLRAQRVPALPLMRGPAARWLRLVARAPFAWQVDPATVDAGEDARVMAQQRSLPAYVRIVGGGPEATMHEGRGIGTAMQHLALAGYRGPVIVAPSSSRYRVIWSAWLGRRGGWGCGGRQDGSRVSLYAYPSARSGNTA
jgi:hypothetical protein